MHLIGWDTVTKNKEEGVIGIQKCELRNRALHATLAWRTFRNPNSLWSRILTSKYLKNVNPPKGKRVVSRTWKNIQKGWEVCQKASRWVIHRGDKVFFMKDTWIPHSPAIDKIIHGPFTEGELSLKIRDIYGNGIWNLEDLSFDLSDDLKATIRDYNIPYNSPKRDSMIWGLMVSFQQAALMISSPRTTQARQGKQFEWICKTKAPNKIRTFL